jgi:hypothetical protein
MSGWDTSLTLITVEVLVHDYGTLEVNGKTIYISVPSGVNFRSGLPLFGGLPVVYLMMVGVSKHVGGD